MSKGRKPFNEDYGYISGIKALIAEGYIPEIHSVIQYNSARYSDVKLLTIIGRAHITTRRRLKIRTHTFPHWRNGNYHLDSFFLPERLASIIKWRLLLQASEDLNVSVFELDTYRKWESTIVAWFKEQKWSRYKEDIVTAFESELHYDALQLRFETAKEKR